jgi:hypothetical protein
MRLLLQTAVFGWKLPRFLAYKHGDSRLAGNRAIDEQRNGEYDPT